MPSFSCRLCLNIVSYRKLCPFLSCLDSILMLLMLNQKSVFLQLPLTGLSMTLKPCETYPSECLEITWLETNKQIFSVHGFQYICNLGITWGQVFKYVPIFKYFCSFHRIFQGVFYLFYSILINVLPVILC